MPSRTRLARLLHRLHPRCRLCGAKVRRGVRYCPAHYPAEIHQHEEMRR